MFSGPHTYTAQGNLWPPTVPDLLRWIKASCDSISPDVICKSFKKCGITNAPDGTEDDIFHAEDKSDDDDPFEGFPGEQIENEREYHDNVVRGAEIVVSDESVDSSAEEDDNDDYYGSTSPGH